MVYLVVVLAVVDVVVAGVDFVCGLHCIFNKIVCISYVLLSVSEHLI